MTKLLLGIDYGTGGCKVTVLDETGAFVGEASTEYVTYHDHPGWSEQEPGDLARRLHAQRRVAGRGLQTGSPHDHVDRSARHRGV